jgi:hypothetical protein
MAKSIFLCNSLNNHVLNGTAYTRPVTIYIGLWTAALTAASHGGTAGEVTGGDYERVAVTNDGSTFDASAAAVIASNDDYEFPDPTGDWGDVVSVGVFDANNKDATDNLLYFDQIPTTTIVAADGAPSIPAGEFTHTEG